MNLKTSKIELEKWLAIFITLMVCTTRLSMALGHVFYGISIAIGLYMFYKERHNLVLPKGLSGLMKAFGVFVVTLIPSIVNSGCFRTGFKFIMDDLLYRALLFVIIVLFIRKKQYIINMLAVFIGVTAIDSIVSLYQVVFMRQYRGWGFGSNTLTLAGVMTMLLPIMVIIMADAKFELKLKRITGISLVLVFAAFIANKSRGAWLTFLSSVPLLLAHYGLNKKRFVAIALAAVCLFSAAAGSKIYTKRIESISNITTDRSNGDRIEAWKSSLCMIEDHPVTGVGLGNWKPMYNAKYKRATDTQNLAHSHNNFVQIGAETGVVGLIGLLAFFGYVLFFFFKGWLKEKSIYDLGCFLVFLNYMVFFALIEFTFSNSSGIRIMWFLMGVLWKLKILEEKSDIQ